MTITESLTRLATSELYIGGEYVPADAGRYYETVEALTGAPTARIAAASVADAHRAADAASAALKEWGGASPAARRAVVQRAAELLGARLDELSDIMTTEMGATKPWCAFNVQIAMSMFFEAAAQAYSAIGETIPSDVPGLTALGLRAPAGVVVGIAPWNAPLILAVRSIAMPLILGNTVILKASEQAPRTQAAIVQAFHDAGAPAGVVNLITNAPEDAPTIVEALIAHPAVARVNFTGSSKIGSIIGELGGRHLTRTVLELGGKAPIVVLDDADVEQAAHAAAFGAFFNSGQICMGTERAIVGKAVVEEFSQKLAARAAALIVGAPDDPSTQIGPVVNHAAARRLAELIDDAVAKGATILAGGTVDRLYVTPTVLANVTPQMRIYYEESFGPVISIETFDDVDDAVAKANDTTYGLSSAVFGRDGGAALDIAKRIKAGICHINSSTVHDEAQMPFGGIGASGWGRFGSRAAIEEFTELRWVDIQSGDREYPI